MLTTNQDFLQQDLMDVVRIFKNTNLKIEHTMSYENSVFLNRFIIEDKTFIKMEQQFVDGEIEFKRYARRYAKLALYNVLSEYYGIKMPWGALTGIRPTKLAYAEQEIGKDFTDLFNKMGVSNENTQLVKRVLSVQEGIYQKKDNNTDFFVSIPFCPSKCNYCSFITADIAHTQQFLEEYIPCLEKEILASKELVGNLRSVYIGGGTPFVIRPSQLKTVLSAVEKIRDNNCEYTVEAGRPDVFSDEKLKLLKDYGVTRICINPQTFSNKTLQTIGRKHTAEQIYQAFDMAEKYNFTINTDLIAGLTGESYDEFVYSVQEAIRLAPENITIHCLCLKSGAKLKEETSYLENGEIDKMVLTSRSLLTQAGYEPYYLYRQKYQVGNNENIGWTKKGKACIYNIDIMEETADNLAVGANAISKKVFTEENRIERYASPKDFHTYFEKIDEIIEKKAILFGKREK